MMEIGEILERANKSRINKINENSTFYRWQSPLFTLDEKNGMFYVAGNPDSNAEINDIYQEVESDSEKNIKARILPHPGLGVTNCSLGRHSNNGSLEIKIKLRDVLKIGGKVYPYLGTGSGAWYLTVPKGCLLEVQANSCDGEMEEKGISPETLARLGVVYNDVTSSLLDRFYINVCDWSEVEGGPFKSIFYTKEEKRWIETARLNYSFKGNKLNVQNQLGSERGSEKRGSAMLLSILAKHPELTEIVAPENIIEPIAPFLVKRGLHQYKLSH